VGDANAGHQCYIHTIIQKMDKRTGFTPYHVEKDGNSDKYDYVGITGRNWLLRLNEHIGEVRRGSRKRFHKAWRENLGLSNINYSSQLVNVNQSFEEAMNWEEETVDQIANGPNGLNMIPGGFKGLKYLHKLRLTDRINISLEEREEAIIKFIKRNPRKGIPNPFLSELWKDDDFYLKIMEARPKSLSPDQVRRIKKLHKSGMPIEEIVKEVGAINSSQVKRVIDGKTYTRYH
jgi:hypothetical protein